MSEFLGDISIMETPPGISFLRDDNENIPTTTLLW